MSKVHQITSATRSQSEQIRARIIRYSWMMGVRTVLFIAAALLHNWWSLALIILSVLLPWIAVIYANSAGERHVVPASYIDNRALPAAEERNLDD